MLDSKDKSKLPASKEESASLSSGLSRRSEPLGASETPSGWTPGLVVRKAVRSVVALGFRQACGYALNGIGTALLARLLSPSEFGLYAIITFTLSFLTSFGDAGLGASLIREAEEPAEKDFRAVFTVQQMLVFAVVVLFWLASPRVALAYHLPSHGAWLFRLAAVSLLVTSFQVIPQIRLERRLAFDKLALVEVGMALAFNVTAVVLAWRGWGAMSFALGMLARSAAGVMLANLVSPWPMGWAWDWARVRRHLRFGLPYQGIGLVSLVKDSIAPVFVGLMLGTSQLGYINWASTVAVYPVVALAALQRIYLPAFSRMQEHREALGRLVEQTLRATHGVVAPLAVLTLVLIEPITRIVFGGKWLVALPLFYFFWIPNIFSPTTAPLMALLNALGRSRTTFSFALLWMLGTWVLGVPLILLFGARGYAMACAGVSLTTVLLFRVAQAQLPFRVLSPILPVWGWAATMGFGAYLFRRALPPAGLVGLVGQLGLDLLAYAVGLVIIYPSTARKTWVWIRGEAWNPASR